MSSLGEDAFFPKSEMQVQFIVKQNIVRRFLHLHTTFYGIQIDAVHNFINNTNKCTLLQHKINTLQL
jgi:hypothetical protein